VPLVKGCTDEDGGRMITWMTRHRVLRAALVCASIAAFAISASAGVKWS
jgi:hypothetical protein